MSTPEDIREDGKRDDAEERFERESPEPCGCQMLSACCGALPGLRSDAAVASHVGVCPRCNEHVGFEKSDENTWKLTSTGVYGDDADGNRGVPLRAYECRECGQEVEVTG